MKRSAMAVILMVAGLTILFVGPLVLRALPATTYWSDADHEEYEKASVAAHAATYGGTHDHSKPHSHEAPQDEEGKARLEATRAEFERHNARLKAARSSRNWLGLGCRGLGLLLAAVGVLIYVQARRLDPK